MLVRERADRRLAPKSAASKKQKIRAEGPVFVDLFAGIGGFHIALEEFGGTCLFASEIDTRALETYRANFNTTQLVGDIKEIDHLALPNFDFLCAGFPCQPFSKGGFRNGFEDTRGTLFFDICKMLEAKQPKFVLLENVPNLVTHDNGNTYSTILRSLRRLGYVVPAKPHILSPHMFGIPVHRPRIYIPAVKKDVVTVESITFNFPSATERKDIYSLMDTRKKNEKYRISAYEEKVLNMWNEFYKGIDLKIIGFPIWAAEFAAEMPESYEHLPLWKQDFKKKNRNLYLRNREFIDKWLMKHDDLSWVKPSHRKFEWQAGDQYNDIYQCLIQFRPSGVRVRKPDLFSTLVAMNHAQIVGKYKRRLSPDETKRLQSFPAHFKLHPNEKAAMKQLGNAVNVEVVKAVVAQMLALTQR